MDERSAMILIGSLARPITYLHCTAVFAGMSSVNSTISGETECRWVCTALGIGIPVSI
jgi:hypothetical protein